jgi:hypothetical protein
MLLPLGDAFTGVCLALPGQPVQPDETRLTLCNLGYARSDCPRFPAELSADAVRFALSSDDGQSLQIYYVLERGHHPAEHGQLTYRTADRTFAPPIAGEAFGQQAAAYAGSYLRRRVK